MKGLVFIKGIAERLPEAVGRHLVWLPYSWRLGKTYYESLKTITWFERASRTQRREYIFQKFKTVVEFAASKNPFYREMYRQARFSVESLRGFDDIKRVPIVTKAALQEWALDRRSTPIQRGLLLNTGGTSGQPLQFWVDRNAFAREWAHMHQIWSRLGYGQGDLKLTFRGKNLGNQLLRYNSVHNEYVVNAYADLAAVSGAVERVAKKRKIRFIHGYPSTVNEFAKYCESGSSTLQGLLGRTLRGVLLASEYPAPQYREQIKRVFNVPSISWYGHSEMAVLAYEDTELEYRPLHTYGYCETVKGVDGEFRLVGTSYDNTVSPFIRYDTGDSVVPLECSEPLEKFKIQSGRIGESILDARGNRISLTALVFGRHHRLFSYARFIQIKQDRPGEATVCVTLPPECRYSPTDLARDFDTGGTEVQFCFERVDAPFRTRSGKTPLLVGVQTGPR